MSGKENRKRINLSLWALKMHAYQENSNDQAEETNCASKDFDNENLHKECRVCCVRQSSSRSNLLNRNEP